MAIHFNQLQIPYGEKLIGPVQGQRWHWSQRQPGGKV